MRQLENELGIGFGETTADGAFTLEWANCMGMCDQGPALLVNDQVYTRVTPETVHEIVAGVPRRGLRRARGRARRSAVRHERHSRPTAHHRARSRPQGRARHGPRRTSSTSSRDSGLKGRGGAGFPTGMKWNFAAAAKADRKYIICNADEGEPGTFKDRVILTEYADLVFEGMTIAGQRHRRQRRASCTCGASTRYLRGAPNEVQDAPRRAACSATNIGGGSGFDFDILVAMGAGAYVCGEETALIECLEGFRGEPRNRPPFPVVTGFLGYPTVVNNVETLAWAACILAKGADWFTGFGTEQVHRPQALQHLRRLRAARASTSSPGASPWPSCSRRSAARAPRPCRSAAPAGICVPARDFGRALAFEDIPTGGSVIVFGPQRDMLDVAAELPRVLRRRELRPVHARAAWATPKLLRGGRAPQGRAVPARRS